MSLLYLGKTAEGIYAKGYPFKFTGNPNPYRFYVNVDGKMTELEVLQESIVPYTGVKDRNNIELFEHDIVLVRGVRITYSNSKRWTENYEEHWVEMQIVYNEDINSYQLILTETGKIQSEGISKLRDSDPVDSAINPVFLIVTSLFLRNATTIDDIIFVRHGV